MRSDELRHAARYQWRYILPALGIPPEIMVGTFVAVNGYFFIPNYGPIIASIDFDTTGTTRIGRYILNHSFMIPGLLSMAFSLVLGLAFAKMLL